MRGSADSGAVGGGTILRADNAPAVDFLTFVLVLVRPFVRWGKLGLWDAAQGAAKGVALGRRGTCQGRFGVEGFFFGGEYIRVGF